MLAEISPTDPMGVDLGKTLTANCAIAWLSGYIIYIRGVGIYQLLVFLFEFDVCFVFLFDCSNCSHNREH